MKPTITALLCIMSILSFGQEKHDSDFHFNPNAQIKLHNENEGMLYMLEHEFLQSKNKHMSETKFNIGDKVRIVNYGHLIYNRRSNGKYESIDINSQIVGKTGIISNAHITQGISNYAIEGIPTKHAWYNDEQLEMVNRNPNTEF